MTSFQNNGGLVRANAYTLKCGLVVGLAGLIALASVTGVVAQQNKPLRLAPVVKAAPPNDLRAPTAKRSAADIANPRSLGISSRLTGGRVEVDRLTALNADEAGILTPDTGSLGNQMWQGSSRGLIDQLLPQLPTRAPSSAMRQLMLKLLLTPAQIPDSPSQQGQLVAKRLSILMTMGALEEADELFNVVPGGQSPNLVTLEADLRFLANDNARACVLAVQEMANKSTAYWQKAFTFCQIMKGEKEKAALSLSLMRELGEEDVAFLALAEGLITGTTNEIPTLNDPSPLHLAMARVGKMDLPADVIAANTPSVLRAIAMLPKVSLGLRLEAAERADVAGALSVDVLRQLYTSVEFSEEDLNNPLSRAEVEFGPTIRALLYHTSLVQTVPTAQAEATARAFALARDEGRYSSAVHVFQPVLMKIPASNELLWFAPEAVRALLLLGDTERARTWYQVLQTGAISNDDAAKEIAVFRPLAKLFGFEIIDDAEQSLTASWWAAVKGQPDAIAKGALLYSLLDALSVDVPETAWDPLIDWQARNQQTLPSVGLLNRLQALTKNVMPEAPVPAETVVADSQPLTLTTTDLVRPLLVPQTAPEALSLAEMPLQNQEPKRVGEIVLLALLAIGESGPANAEVGVLSTVLRALSAAGLKEDARALALEAALMNGL